MVTADILAAFPVLGGRHSTSMSPSSIMLAVVYFEDSFHQVKGILFYSKFAENFFYYEWMLGFVTCFILFRWSYGFSFLRAKLLQLCPTLCDPIDYCPPSSPGEFSSKYTGVGCHFLLQGIFLTQGLNQNLLCHLHLAGVFFTTSTNWEALKTKDSILKEKKSAALTGIWTQDFLFTRQAL